MELKKRIKTFSGVCIVILLLISGLFFLNDLTVRKVAIKRNGELYERAEEYDVLFVGSSHVVEGIYPMELWDDWGITSYNIGRYGHYLPGDYYALEDALNYVSPRLVVIDTLDVGRENKARADEEGVNQLHNTMDTIPFSLQKIKAVMDLYPDEKKIQMEMLFPFSVYHSRWEELGQDDFRTELSKEKGAVTRTEIAEPIEGYARISGDKIFEEKMTGEVYLEKMISMCKNRGIEVLLVFLPFPADEDDQMDSNTAERVAEENGVPYINFLDCDVVDFQTGLHDPDSHLNALGAKAVTDFLGEYISAHYALDDRRKNEAYGLWHQDYEQYFANKIHLLEEQSELRNYLMLCNDKDFVVKVVVHPGILSKEDEVLQKLLRNLSSVVETDADLGGDTDIYIQVEDKRNGEVLCCRNFAFRPQAVAENE